MTDQQTQQLLNLKRQLEVISSELHTLRTCFDMLQGKVKTLHSSLDSLMSLLPAESSAHDTAFELNGCICCGTGECKNKW
jgi:prefoldin subunit 5